MSLAAYVQSLPEARGSGDALVSLYADLSGTRASNPGAFRAKVEWWARTLGHVLWTGLLPSAVTLAVDEALPNAFALASAGRPMCIAVVLDELAREGKVMRRSAFLERAPLQQRASFASTLVDYLAKPAWRAAARLWTESEAIGDEAVWAEMRGEWVFLHNVERAAELYRKKMDRIASVLDTVVTRTELYAQLAALRDESGHPHLSPRDCEVVARYLERDMRVLVVDGEIVKLLRPGDARTIGETEKGVLAVRQMQQKLTQQVDELEERVQKAHARIVAALRSKQPEATAKAYLRTKKQLEDLLAKRVGALETVSSMLLKMEQAVGDAEVVRTYETSAAALRSILADPALQPERVDATMDQLAEAVGDSDELHAAITSGSGVDDEEIARELEQLAIDAEGKGQGESSLEKPAEKPAEPAQSTAEPAPSTAEPADESERRFPSAPQHTPPSQPAPATSTPSRHLAS